MFTHESVITFLEENPAFELKSLETEAGLPVSTLSKAMRGNRRLNDNHLQKLRPVLTKYGFGRTEGDQAKVMAIINNKGGVGKTTTTLNLGKALTLEGYRVLVVDMDPQGNLSQGLGIDHPEEQVRDALTGKKPLPVLEVEQNFCLAPSDLELDDIMLDLIQSMAGHNRLNKALMPLRKDFDYILIDCPPSLNSPFTENALVAADSCIVTLQPETPALKGMDKIFMKIQSVKEEANDKLKVEGIVFTMVDRKTVLHQSNMEYVVEELGDFRIFDTLIRKNIMLAEAHATQTDVFVHAPKSNGAEDYQNLAKELTHV